MGLEQLWKRKEPDRNEAIQSLLKIFGNLLNHPSENDKYGNLNLETIRNKLNQCQPAFDLLILSGFEESESDNGTILIWKKSNESLRLLIQMFNVLKPDEIDKNEQNEKNNEQSESLGKSKREIMNTMSIGGVPQSKINEIYSEHDNKDKIQTQKENKQPSVSQLDI